MSLSLSLSVSLSLYIYIYTHLFSLSLYIYIYIHIDAYIHNISARSESSRLRTQHHRNEPMTLATLASTT